LSKIYFFNEHEDCLEKLNSLIDENVVFIIDSKVKKLHPTFFKENKSISLVASEKIKSFESIEQLALKLLKLNINRSSTIISIGGGSIGDAIGFLASIYMRGVRWINIPTTYLSQIDSAYGGKTAINLKDYKNLLGSFYEPVTTLVSLQFLTTLPKKEIISGKGEEYKYSIISKHIYDDYISLNRIKKLQKLKASFYKKDLFDKKDKRIFLNFGHTLAHALEKVEGSKKWSHGEAVFRGCDFNLFLTGSQRNDLPIKKKIDPQSIAKIVTAMGYDKKNLKKIKFILKEDQLVIKEFEKKEILEYLKDYVSKQ